MKKLRLVKIVMQAHYVLDDGETLIEQRSDPFEVAAADVPSFSGKWAHDFEQLQAQVYDQEETPPNRAARRAAAKTNGV